MMFKSRSAIWNNFTKVSNEKAQCDICSCVLSIKCGSTTNLIRHTKKKHPTISILHNKKKLCPNENSSTSQSINVSNSQESMFKIETDYIKVEPDEPEYIVIEHEDVSSPSLPSQFQPSFSDSIVPSAESSSKSCFYNRVRKPNFNTNHRVIRRKMPLNKERQINRQITKLLASNHLPFTLLKNADFKKLLEMLNPIYSLPSTDFFYNYRLPRLYDELSEIIRNELSATIAVSITTNGSFLINNENFLVLTAHYINEQCQIKSVLLDSFKYENQTPEEIATELRRIVSKWMIHDKVVGLVSDDLGDMQTVAKLQEWPHLPCYEHSINTAIRAGLEEINVTLNKIKEIIMFLKTKTQLTSVLKNMGYNDSNMIQNVREYELVNRFIQSKESILSVLESVNHEQIRTELTTKDWEILEHSSKILKMFQEVTKALKAEKYLKISIIIYLNRIILSFCKKYIENDLPIEITKMLKTMREILKQKISNLEKNSLVAEATVLDPRFKKYVFKNTEALELAVDNLKKAAFNHDDVIRQNQDKITEHSFFTVEDSIPEDESIWVEYDQKTSNIIKSDSMIGAGVIEMNRYLQELVILRQQDPLKWWLERKHLYPLLFDIMRQKLCVPATSFSYDQKFSSDGFKENESSVDRIRQLLFINANYKYLS